MGGGLAGNKIFKFPQNFLRAYSPTDANRACELNGIKPLAAVILY